MDTTKRGQAAVAAAMLLVLACAPADGPPAPATPQERLAALLEEWRQAFATRGSGAWQRTEELARLIAEDPDFPDELLEEEKDRVLEAAQALGDEEDLDFNEKQNRNDAYDGIWQALEDALELRVDTRIQDPARTSALRARLSEWQVETARSPDAATDAHWQQAAASLAAELARGPYTEADLAIELELAKRRVRRLHGGPLRIYPTRPSMLGLLARPKALEDALALLAEKAESGVRE